MKYSVVIPCYKSSHTIRQVVEEAAKELARLGRTPYEFILVDDFSPDDGATVTELQKEMSSSSWMTICRPTRLSLTP